MREDLEHNFDKAEFNNSCRVMKCVKQLFPHSEKQAETWAVFCYESWTAGEGGTPEQQRDRRNPKWKKSLELFEKRRQKQNCITTIMLDLQVQSQEQFATFWNKSFPQKKCPALPKKNG